MDGAALLILRRLPPFWALLLTVPSEVGVVKTACCQSTLQIGPQQVNPLESIDCGHVEICGRYCVLQKN